ncbi:uncharacterized protein LOC101890863 [Musca domestica]|uniref:Uncharacterized protein LOC101890863 n=1 Tax=Musca domestica TaxID=7370 RepID=A0A9J7CHT6_MUSDO|nr:uncharacterized protein LOC101890863 [Musca domestica]
MHSQIAVALVLIAFAVLCQGQGNPLFTGQPGCLTQEELTVGVYRHFRNTRAYWRCQVLGVAAIFELCPQTHKFLDTVKECVPWNQWVWTPTVAPPSSPVVVVSQLPVFNQQ